MYRMQSAIKIFITLIFFTPIITVCTAQTTIRKNLQPSEEIKKKNNLNNDPNAYWDTYMAQYEDGPGVVIVNMDLYKKTRKKKFPFLLMTGVTAVDCDSNGFPTKSEFNRLYEINDTIFNLLSYHVEMILAGTCTHGCERLDYYYLTDTNGIINLIRTKYNEKFKISKPYINIREDKKWEDYVTFVYPDKTDQEYMKNEKAVMNLYQSGDNLQTPRKVDHWIYFKNEKSRDQFISDIAEMGFIIEDKGVIKKSKYKFKLQISRVDRIDTRSITRVTVELNELSDQNKGKYDGWETFVIK